MKITITFDSLEEFTSFKGVQPGAQVNNYMTAPAPAAPDVMPGDWTPGGGDPDQEFSDRTERPQEAPQKAATSKPKPSTRKAEKPAQTAAGADPEPVTEDFRVEVRKQLAALNRKVGYNRAAELIKELTGADAKLTEVALADLPKIMAAAKEETNAD